MFATYLFVYALKVHCECLSPAVAAFFVTEADGDDVVPQLYYLAKELFLF